MPDVVKHAWTHRPRAAGGTDPIEVSSIQPHAYTYFDTKSLEDSTSYDLTILDGASYAGSVGIADTIGIGDPAGETFMIDEDDEDVIWVVCEHRYVASDVQCYFATPFDGLVSLWFAQANYGHGGYTSPVGEVLGTAVDALAATDAGSLTVRLSGIVLMDPDPYDPDITNAGNSAVRVRVQQDSGSTQTLTQGWADFCRVTLANGTVTYTPPP